MLTLRISLDGSYLGTVTASPTQIHFDPGLQGLLAKLIPGWFPHLDPAGVFQSLVGLPRSCLLRGVGTVHVNKRFTS